MKLTGVGIKALATGDGLGPAEVAAGANPQRGRLLAFKFTCDDAPVDHTLSIRVSRKTANGTNSAMTLAIADSGDVLASANAVGKQTTTVSSTLTIKGVYDADCNSKYGVEYWAPPGQEIVYPAVAASGLVWDTPRAPVTGDNVRLWFMINEE